MSGGLLRSLSAPIRSRSGIALLVERLETEILALPERVAVEAVEDVSDDGPPTAAEVEHHVEIEPA